jgi:hypothetical protein
LERFEKLFREAERIRPPAGMWDRIAARAALAGKAGDPARTEGAESGRGWKMAASLAVGLGLLAALLMVLRPAPRVADKAGGAEDFSVARAEESSLPDAEDLYWHADLGEESGVDWEVMPLLDEAAADE